MFTATGKPLFSLANMLYIQEKYVEPFLWFNKKYKKNLLDFLTQDFEKPNLSYFLPCGLKL